MPGCDEISSQEFYTLQSSFVLLEIYRSRRQLKICVCLEQNSSDLLYTTTATIRPHKRRTVFNVGMAKLREIHGEKSQLQTSDVDFEC